MLLPGGLLDVLLLRSPLVLRLGLLLGMLGLLLLLGMFGPLWLLSSGFLLLLRVLFVLPCRLLRLIVLSRLACWTLLLLSALRVFFLSGLMLWLRMLRFRLCLLLGLFMLGLFGLSLRLVAVFLFLVIPFMTGPVLFLGIPRNGCPESQSENRSANNSN
jgi:hypothetical protein